MIADRLFTTTYTSDMQEQWKNLPKNYKQYKMNKQREEIAEEIKKEIDVLQNNFDTVQLVENQELTKIQLMIPYCNGQVSTLSMTLQGEIPNEVRYKTLVKIIAYQTIMLQLIEFPDPVIEGEEPFQDEGNPFPI
jgi:hypothetical protein